MIRPLVSIVVPTYGRAHLTPYTLDSVLAQDYPNVELIVVDDGSSDGTHELLERYAAEVSPDRFHWHAIPHGGQARAIDHGYSLARGEIFGTLASDDLLEPDGVSILVSELERPGPIVAYGQNRLIDESGQQFDLYPAEAFSLERSVALSHCIPRAGTLFHRRLHDILGGWDPENRYFPDQEYWIRASLVGELAYVPRIVGSMRVHPGSVTHGERGLDMARQRIEMLDRLYADPALAPRIASVRSAAYRNAFILGGMDVASEEVNRPGERFFVEDTLAAQNSQLAAGRRASELLAYRASIEQAKRTLAEQDAVIRQLQDAVADRDRRLYECYAALSPRQ